MYADTKLQICKYDKASGCYSTCGKKPDLATLPGDCGGGQCLGLGKGCIPSENCKNGGCCYTTPGREGRDGLKCSSSDFGVAGFCRAVR